MMENAKNLLRRLIPRFLLSWYHFGWAVLGAAVYRFPARDMTVIGVTGTDGKSTTVEMITRIFKEAGFKTCSTSSVWFQIGDKREKNHLKMGMPGRMFLQKFLAQAVKQGCTHAVIEVSSEGILQHRHRFLNFHTAVITNLSPEHIERHGSFEKYRAEKQKLFRSAKNVHIVNIDDENAGHFLKFEAEQKVGYGVKNRISPKLQTLYAENVQDTKDGVRFLVKDTEMQLQFPGPFNVYNALAALCVSFAHGISLERGKTALEDMPGMPGRMERVVVHPYTVIVDYAVTPKALEGLYLAVQRLYEPERMICVFGACGGGRDKWKRPILGKIASSLCDEIILTNEDPYDENPAEIIDQIAEGAGASAHKVLDRRKAIRKALEWAKEGDAVVISGKGSEDAIAMERKKILWDERKVVKEEFARMQNI